MEPMQGRKAIVALTVEPGETSLSTRKLVIESAGFNCLSAVTARQALELAQVHPIHAALIDSDIDDLESFIKSLQRLRPGIRVYVLSGQGWASQQLRPHIARVFQKLADPREIVEELISAFPERSGAFN